MRTYKSLERKSSILGLPLTDLMLLLVLLIGLVMAGSLASLLFPVPRLYYLGTVGIVFGLMLGLKLLNRNRHPAYLFASLSFYLRQARRIRVMAAAKPNAHD